MFSSVSVLFEANLSIDYEPLLTGFKKRSHRDTVALLKELRPIMFSVGNKMSGGSQGGQKVDDWIADFVAQKLPKLADVALRNMKTGKHKLGQFPALVAASFRRFVLNELRNAKTRATREREAGMSRGTTVDTSSQVAASDKKKIADIVRSHINKEKDPEARKFLLHLTGLANSSTLTFSKLAGGSISDALTAAGLDAKAWQNSGRPAKVRARLFRGLGQDKTLRKFVGVESETLYGPGLTEVVKAANPRGLEGCQYAAIAEDAFHEWLIGVLHG